MEHLARDLAGNASDILSHPANPYYPIGTQMGRQRSQRGCHPDHLLRSLRRPLQQHPRYLQTPAAGSFKCRASDSHVVRPLRRDPHLLRGILRLQRTRHWNPADVAWTNVERVRILGQPLPDAGCVCVVHGGHYRDCLGTGMLACRCDGDLQTPVEIPSPGHDQLGPGLRPYSVLRHRLLWPRRLWLELLEA
jgi:hypothetical protein